MQEFIQQCIIEMKKKKLYKILRDEDRMQMSCND